MRIDVVTPYFPLPGHEHYGRSAFETVVRLSQMADIRVLCPVAKYPAYLQPRSYNSPRLRRLEWMLPTVNGQYVSYPVVPMLSRGINAYTCYERMYDALRSKPPADVILNYWLYPEGCAAVMLGRKLGIPAVVGAIGSDLCAPRGFATRQLTRWTLRSANRVITVSEDLRRRAITLGASEDQCVAIKNGCDTQRFPRRSRADAKNALGLAPGSESVLFVGSLVRHKGVFDLIEAAEALIRIRPRLEVFLIGEGAEMAGVRNRLWNGSGASRIHVLGSRTPGEVSLWMSATDVFCLPSHREGCPNALLEAISTGCRIVATAVGGVPELLDSENDILVPSEHPSDLAEALLNALTAQKQFSGQSSRPLRTWDTVASETFETCRCAVSSHNRHHAPSTLTKGVTPGVG